ncbi:NSP protein [Corchorus yellow vein virus - [Hoa Binh]]|uniref:Nuclear shuttle protein n=1 Tax=Corchorus yellow vein virus TaxID=333361 RepID=Q645G8_9GEMI|nr:NSP protein [Corchorus yellow vein virus - [Hoa Binh]]AAU29408.1 NSP protein [Corchorus yellow vein virus - [Hoa Binh]]
MYTMRYRHGAPLSVRRPIYRRTYVRRFPVRRPPVRRQLSFSNKPADDKMTKQRLHENQYGTQYAISNNTSIPSFVTYPRLGGPSPNRSRDYMKLNRLRYKGTVTINNTQPDVTMSGETKIEGVFTMAIVMDRKPHVGPSGSLPKFEELFGANTFSHGSLDIAAHLKDRYYVRHVCKRVISMEKDSTILNLTGSMSLSSSRFTCWASFKDLNVDSCNGAYSNVAKNAILVYYCWMSDEPSRASTFVSFDLDYLG